MFWLSEQPFNGLSEHSLYMVDSKKPPQESNVRFDPAILVKVPFEFPQAWWSTSAVGSPRREYRILVLRVHKARDVLDSGNGTPHTRYRPPWSPQALDVRQNDAVACDPSKPAIRPRP